MFECVHTSQLSTVSLNVYEKVATQWQLLFSVEVLFFALSESTQTSKTCESGEHIGPVCLRFGRRHEHTARSMMCSAMQLRIRKRCGLTTGGSLPYAHCTSSQASATFFSKQHVKNAHDAASAAEAKHGQRTKCSATVEALGRNGSK
jgi:hypothetical protein